MHSVPRTARPGSAFWIRNCLRVTALVLLAGCGGSPSSPSTPGTTTTITLTASGLSPADVRISAGSQVLFVNNDIRNHAMSSDPITIHTDCPAINEVGTLTPGQRRSTGVLTVQRTCGFHDHLNEFDSNWKGTIVVQ
jgi:plastocyanin